MLPGRTNAAPAGRLALAAAAAAVLAAPGCGGSGLSHSPAAYGAPTAEQAVRTFLGALQEEEYPAMGQHFGTREGPAEKQLGLTEVEQRMVVLAGLLQHDDYSVERSSLTEPDPRRTRFMVTLRGTRNGTVTLPFHVVQAESGRWFVEQIVTDPLSGS